MSRTVVVRTLVGALVLALLAWVIVHTRWEEVEVDDPARGAAAADRYYALRQVLAGAGATLTVRTSMEPLPPRGATLWLESNFWNIFPERDAQLKLWVQNGGQLVLRSGIAIHHKQHDLAWIPLVIGQEALREAASAAESSPSARVRSARLWDPDNPKNNSCWDYEETVAASPAFERGRIFDGCANPFEIHVQRHVTPTWMLTLAHTPAASRGHFTPEERTLLARVPVGAGSVTVFTPFMFTHNRALLAGDNALIMAAVLQAVPGRAVWIVEDEAREPLLAWLWHEARTPSLLALVAIALALWRLMVRFGPREAVPPQARRSMGEQVRGTGHFIAGSDARALHAATRQAFEAVARRRVEGWAELDDTARVQALVASMPHPQAIAPAALQASMNIGGGATAAQIVAAIAVLEQARRALLRAPAPPLSP